MRPAQPAACRGGETRQDIMFGCLDCARVACPLLADESLWRGLFQRKETVREPLILLSKEKAQ